LADLAFAGLASYLKERMEGQEFIDVNQVMQRVVAQENRAKDVKSYGRFRYSGTREKEKHGVNFMDEDLASDSDAEVCVAEWVDTPKHKPMSCSFLKPKANEKEEMQYTFDVTKCDRLFNMLVQGGVIRLKEGHIIPTVELISKRKYGKWHDSYSHMTNRCNYFHRQVQSALNDGRLTLGDGGKMRLDIDPFPVNTVGFGEKRILVRSDQADTTKGKIMVVSDELQNKMIKPNNPKVGVWKQNVWRSPVRKVKPNSNALITKYARQQRHQMGEWQDRSK
jgi:hypothetical protein